MHCFCYCSVQSKLLALPTIVNGSILNLLKGVPALYTAPLSRSDEFAKLERTKELSMRLGDSANSAWRKLENALRSWAAFAHTGNRSQDQVAMRFAERRANAEKKSVANVVENVVVTVGPVDSHIAASQLCRELGGDVCSHSEFVSAFENNAGGGCHACGWTLSKIKGDAVFLVESMADPDLCDSHSSSSGITMCKFDDTKPLPVHCCLSPHQG